MKKIKKEITFYYIDTVQKKMMELIARQAHEMGYVVKLTNNPVEKSQIGVYCEHFNYPHKSKFSVIMLHDVTQSYTHWPDVWKREPWYKYDLGFLPSELWEQMWHDSSRYFYANPRKGVYKVGWPKMDEVAMIDINEKRNELLKKYNLDEKKNTILYAPAWENDGKEHDFILATENLNVNRLIKQYPYSTTDNSTLKPFQKETERMYELHKSLPDVYYMDAEESILNAILLCDILVSEESSTMCEAVMMGKPAISVYNWLIPDTDPPRYPNDDYEFVEKCAKEDLSNKIIEMLDNYELYETKAKQYAKKNFGGLKNVSKQIMMVINSLTQDENTNIQPSQAMQKEHMEFVKYLSFHWFHFKRNISGRYNHNYLCKIIIDCYLRLKKTFQKND